MPRIAGVDIPADKPIRISLRYIYGVGPTKRIILWDTALDGSLTPAEIRSLAAHEFGHVEANHVWKSIAWLFLFAVPAAFVVARVTRLRGGLGRPAAVPLALLAFTVLELALLPATNAISRRYEAEADWLAIRATNDPGAFAGLTRALADASLAHSSVAEEYQERILNDGSRWEVYKRFFTGEGLAAELGGGRVLHEGRWFVVVASP
jgi:Zn-dependent protease with chaperone function